MRRGASIGPAAVILGLAAWPAAGQPSQTAAMVVAVEAGGPEVDELELLAAGRIIALGVNDRVVLGYVGSCVVETIAGPGSVRVGESSGALDGAAVLVERRTVDCEGRPQPGMSAGEGGALRSRSLARRPAGGGRARDMLAALRAVRDAGEAAGRAAAEAELAAARREVEELRGRLEEARRPWWRRWTG